VVGGEVVVHFMLPSSRKMTDAIAGAKMTDGAIAGGKMLMLLASVTKPTMPAPNAMPVAMRLAYQQLTTAAPS
jgi:hypothetical protein